MFQGIELIDPLTTLKATYLITNWTVNSLTSHRATPSHVLRGTLMNLQFSMSCHIHALLNFVLSGNMGLGTQSLARVLCWIVALVVAPVQLRKLDTRIDLMKSATAKSGGVYLYANQQVFCPVYYISGAMPQSDPKAS